MLDSPPLQSLEPEPDEAPLMATIFDRYTRGHGAHAIARRLNDNGHRNRAERNEICSPKLECYICFALTKDLVNDVRDRCGGVD